MMEINNNNSGYYLFLDDERVPEKVTWVNLPNVTWTIVRSYNEFVNTIQQLGLPKMISYDHDLADEHYAEYHAAHNKESPTVGNFRYDILKEKTGYDAAKWLANHCINNKLEIPPYFVHTMNPIGGKNIISILESAKKSINV